MNWKGVHLPCVCLEHPERCAWHSMMSIQVPYPDDPPQEVGTVVAGRRDGDGTQGGRRFYFFGLGLWGRVYLPPETGIAAMFKAAGMEAFATVIARDPDLVPEEIRWLSEQPSGEPVPARGPHRWLAAAQVAGARDRRDAEGLT